MSRKEHRNAMAAREAVGAFLKDCQYGDVDGVKRYLEAARKREESTMADVIQETKDSNGRTALHFAAFEGQVAVLRYLLQMAPKCIDCKDDEGNTPLILAAQGERHKAVVALVEAGANVNAANGTGVRAVHHAAGNGDQKILELLHSKGADLEAASDGGRPLHWAAGSGQLSTIQQLIDWGVDLNATNSQGLPAVVLAAAAGADAVVQLMVSHGADCGMILSGNVTLLHICADMGAAEAVRALLDTPHGQKCALIRNDEGLLPVQCAATHGHRDLVEDLLSHSNCDLTVDQLLEEGKVRAIEEEAAHQAQQQAKEPVSDPIAEPGNTTPDATQKAEAQQVKEKGNSCFKAKDFAQALDHFTQAISLDGTDGTFFSNRSACHMEMGSPELALADANRACQLRSTWAKAHYRRAVALLALNRYEDAATAAFDALKLDEHNAELKALLKKAVSEGRLARQSSPSTP